MTKMSIELLIEARGWLSDEKHWCRGYRWNTNGSNCSLGALDRVSGFGAMNWWLAEDDDSVWASIHQLVEAALILDGSLAEFPGKHLPSTCIALFNDRAGYQRVLEMYDLAIKLAQESMDRQAKALVESSVGEAVAK